MIPTRSFRFCKLMMLTGLLCWCVGPIGAQSSSRLRCGTQAPAWSPHKFGSSDCDGGRTIIDPVYDGGGLLEIPVVFHIIYRRNGQGKITAQKVREQIEILNQDFGAEGGTPGAGGVDTGIRFYLATVDPAGRPSSGITFTANDRWFDDATYAVRAEFGEALMWDPNRYLNIFVNSGGGAAGYVVNMPWMTGADPAEEGVVVAYDLVGYTPAIQDFDLGRAATHEVGHYLGLEHTFEVEGRCESGDCYRSGDFICDTEPHRYPNDYCDSGARSCSSADPIHNYMNYTPDACMNQFTREQANRMRCSIMTYRASLIQNQPPVEEAELEARWIPHVTRAGAGFSTTLLISNTASSEQEVLLRGYDEDGEALIERSVKVPSGGFIQADAVELLGVNTSHVAIEGSEDCTVAVGYRADQTGGATAHVNETQTVGQRFRFFPGERGLVFDGLAVLNLGDVPARITLRLRDGNGRSLASQVLTGSLDVKAKLIATLESVFANTEAGLIELESSQPVMLLTLRGSLAGAEPAYLYQTFPFRTD